MLSAGFDGASWLRALQGEDQAAREAGKRWLLTHVAEKFGGVIRDIWMDFPRLHPHSTEDDFRQDVLCRVESRIGGLQADDVRQFRGWVVQVIRSAALDQYRRVRGPGSLRIIGTMRVGTIGGSAGSDAGDVVDPADPRTGPLTGARRKDLYATALGFLDRFSEVERTIFRLRAECDLTFSEVAVELSEQGLVGPGRQQKHLGRHQIQRIYDKILFELQGYLGSSPSKI